jgi:hypothetical protein
MDFAGEMARLQPPLPSRETVRELDIASLPETAQQYLRFIWHLPQGDYCYARINMASARLTYNVSPQV